MNGFKTQSLPLSRRQFVKGVTTSSALIGIGGCISHQPLTVSSTSPTAFTPEVLDGNQFNLTLGYQRVNYTGKNRVATSVNGSIPAPTLRWQQGQDITLRIKNNLAEDSSIHWHGIILPTAMDGVPGLSFEGIKPGETFEYKFTVNQSGTYWYHSHSGFQEQLGLYGAIVIEPDEPEPFRFDREYTVMLSDWSDDNPSDVYATLKKQSHFYNTNPRTLEDLFQDIQHKGIQKTWQERAMWNHMRMSDRDISDVTGYTYTYLMNGNTPATGWKGVFKSGEKVRLRFINGSAMTFFDVRIPGLKMTVVAADGQSVHPVTVDEFRMGVAETYDVIVEPKDDSAYTLFAQAMDRSGYARGTLTPNTELQAIVPEMDSPPALTHADIGMSHSDHNMPQQKMNHEMVNREAMDHGTHHSMKDMANGISAADNMSTIGRGSNKPIHHQRSEFGPHVDMRVESASSQLDDPGIGLREHQSKHNRKVLTYADLFNLNKTLDQREPDREIELHLTGNMYRYMWSFSGIKFSDAEPLELKYGERVRITLVNDTMMNHPIHLHGMWSDLETGDGMHIPRKHTVIVQPGSKISYLVSVNARGRWAYHCHLLYHMMGMFREVRVR